jgi:hypothetical protein
MLTATRDARVFVMAPDGVMRDQGTVAVGVPRSLQVPRSPPPLGWPLLLLTPRGDAFSTVGVRADDPRAVEATDWAPLDPPDRALVEASLRGEVRTGLPSPFVVLAWGLPAAVVSASSSPLGGDQQIWRYSRDGHDVLVYLRDGRVERLRGF